VKVVADACPLIFLAKLRCLELLDTLFAGPILIAESVRQEVLADPVTPDEAEGLGRFLLTAWVEEVSFTRRYASAMSRSDQETLALAERGRADLLLTDDRLVREMAAVAKIRPMGTLGVLVLAMRKKVLTKKETQALVETLIRCHKFRISIELYEQVLRTIRDG
jgi:predicted nucleic acid-binding protein